MFGLFKKKKKEPKFIRDNVYIIEESFKMGFITKKERLIIRIENNVMNNINNERYYYNVLAYITETKSKVKYSFCTNDTHIVKSLGTMEEAKLLHPEELI